MSIFAHHRAMMCRAGTAILAVWLCAGFLVTVAAVTDEENAAVACEQSGFASNSGDEDTECGSDMQVTMLQTAVYLSEPLPEYTILAPMPEQTQVYAPMPEETQVLAPMPEETQVTAAGAVTPIGGGDTATEDTQLEYEESSLDYDTHHLQRLLDSNQNLQEVSAYVGKGLLDSNQNLQEVSAYVGKIGAERDMFISASDDLDNVITQANTASAIEAPAMVRTSAMVRPAPAMEAAATVTPNVAANVAANVTAKAHPSLELRQDPEASGNVSGAASSLGVSLNGAGDLNAFLSALWVNSATTVVLVLMFSCCRRAYPRVYADSVPEGQAIPEGFFSWICSAWNISNAEIIEAEGLDTGMLLKFMSTSTRILMWIGVPLCAILCPLHFCLGGGAAGEDHLSAIAFGNVTQGNWICIFHGIIVWYVVFVLQWHVWQDVTFFAEKRREWCMKTKFPQCKSVLVTVIPDGLNTAPALLKFFNEDVFASDVVAQVHLVKDVRDLQAIKEEIKQLEKARRGEDTRLRDAEKVRLEERARELAIEIDGNEDYNCSAAFVTFRTTLAAVTAYKLFSPEDDEELECIPPPAPEDVQWNDLMVDPTAQRFRDIVGYALIACIFAVFMPTITVLTSCTSVSSLQNWFPILGNFLANNESIAELYEGMFASVLVTNLMGFIPTFLAIIASRFFVLFASTNVQLYIQRWYYLFLVIFVLLVPALGPGLINSFELILSDPGAFMRQMFAAMCASTHFFLNYYPVQWVTHGTNLCRTVNLAKYLLFTRMYTEDVAKEMSEPEDQDFYGIGSRSARNTLLLVIAVVFCTLSPLMSILGVINFVIGRLFYAYLFVFAETEKPDLGGKFFMNQVYHLEVSVYFYILLMFGVLQQRGNSMAPAIVAISAAVPMFLSQRRILHTMDSHETLNFSEMAGAEIAVSKIESYRQPELLVAERRDRRGVQRLGRVVC